MSCCCGGFSRRDLLRYAVLGVGALAAGPLEALAATRPVTAGHTGRAGLSGAKPILHHLVQRYASVKDDPWAMMHGVRAFGKGFMLDKGSAVDYLCTHFLTPKTAGGRRYLFVSEATQGHANTLLKTFLEAGVSVDHPFILAGRRYTVGEILSSAKQLFTFDLNLSPLHETRDEVAWSIIAFSMTTRPDQAVWKNAVGQEIRLHDVITTVFKTVELASANYAAAMQQGIMPAQRDRITHFTCGGTHVIYSLAVAVRHGYLGEEGRRRLARILDLLIWRLEADLYLVDQRYRTMAGIQSHVRHLYALATRLKFLGHAMEVLSYVRLFRLYTPTPAQEAQIKAAIETLAATILTVGQIDIAPLRKQHPRLYSLFVGDAGHAYHGLMMARGVNQI